jgi:hypothetical protein
MCVVFSVCTASFIFRQAARARRIGKVLKCEKLHMREGTLSQMRVRGVLQQGGELERQDE